MTRLLCTGDLHAGRQLAHRSRTDELNDVLGEMCQIAKTERCDAVLWAGDIFENVNPSAEAESVIYRALLDLAHEGLSVVVIEGNHGSAARWQNTRPLWGAIGITVVPAFDPVNLNRNIVELNGGVQVACLPWLNERRRLQAASFLGESAKSEYADAMPIVLRALCDQMDPGRPRILLAHLMISDSLIGGTERRLTTSETYAVRGRDLPSVDFTVLGHLHRPQNPPNTPETTRYVGSPMPLDFSETAPRSCWLIDTDTGLNSVIPIRSHRKLENIHGTMEELRAMRVEPETWYKVTVKASRHEPGVSDRVREAMGPNVLGVKEELPEHEAVAEAESMRGLQPVELFNRYLDRKGGTDTEVTRMFEELWEQAA